MRKGIGLAVYPQALNMYQLVVGLSMHDRQDRYMVVRAVQMAVWQRTGGSETILHSDRGGQFISGTYQKFRK